MNVRIALGSKRVARLIKAFYLVSKWGIRIIIGLAITSLILAVVAGIFGFVGLVLAAEGSRNFFFLCFWCFS